MTDSEDTKSIPITFSPPSSWSSGRTNHLEHGAGALSVSLEADYSEEKNDKLIIRLGPSETDATMPWTVLSMTMVTKEDADAVMDFFSAVFEKVSESRDRLVGKIEEAGAYAEFKAQREVAETADSSQDENSV